MYGDGSDISSGFSNMSPYSMTRYRHNMQKPGFQTMKKKQQKNLRDRSESERLDVSKHSNSSYI